MRKLIIKSEWTYEDYLEISSRKDNDVTQQRWLLLIAEINRNWSESIDSDIHDVISDADGEMK
jgi:hypothetical protein